MIDSITCETLHNFDMASSEAVSVESFLQDAINCMIPWKEVAPDEIDQWFALFAKAKGTCKDFILVSCLPIVSALMGNTVVEIFEDYKESVNLYILALGGPSTGKTQSHKNCDSADIAQLERKSGGRTSSRGCHFKKRSV